MAIVVFERWERSLTGGDNPSAELGYEITGTDSVSEARAAMLAVRPATFEYLVPVSDNVEWEAPSTHRGSVNYGPRKRKEIGESDYEFETGGGQQKIFSSLATIHSYPAPGRTAPDHKRLIGVDKNGVDGVEITVPVYKFSETHYLSWATVSAAYKTILFNLTGKTNQNPWRGFAAGEVLFLGASGKVRTDDIDWAVSFKFAASPNLIDLVVGDITGIAKKGWEYLWIRYEDSVDETANTSNKVPIAAYVEQVYREDDFAQLLIGS